MAFEKEGLQAIATRVSTGEECSIIIEDGYSSELSTATPTATKTWKRENFNGYYKRKNRIGTKK